MLGLDFGPFKQRSWHHLAVSIQLEDVERLENEINEEDSEANNNNNNNNKMAPKVMLIIQGVKGEAEQVKRSD